MFQGEGLKKLFKKLGKCAGKTAKKLAIKLTKNPTRPLEFGADLPTAAATRNFKAIAAAAFSVISSFTKEKGSI